MSLNETISAAMVNKYCSTRVAAVMTPNETALISRCLLGLCERGRAPPRRGSGPSWGDVANATGVPLWRLEAGRLVLAPLFEAIHRSFPSLTVADLPKPRRRPRPKTIAHPLPLWTEWEDPPDFHHALTMHMTRHGETAIGLYRALQRRNPGVHFQTLQNWCKGYFQPRSIEGLEVLTSIEGRYRLPIGYFRAKLMLVGKAPLGHRLDDFSRAKRAQFSWHLPDDFNARSLEAQNEILEWVQRVVLSGSTLFTNYLAAAVKNSFAIRFHCISGERLRVASEDDHDDDDDATRRTIDAPALLESEMLRLKQFKTVPLAVPTMARTSIWNGQTVLKTGIAFGMLFGGMSAPENGAVFGRGVAKEKLCFAMLVFPSVWDWYLQWRENRRGFYTRWEIDVLRGALSLLRRETGWLRQSPDLADHLTPVQGLLSATEIAQVQDDWDGACDRVSQHLRTRATHLVRLVQVHRDPFEPILPVLTAANPLAEYKKIVDEVVRYMPDERAAPRAAAEGVRAVLMLRFGMHLGLRQRNLRELRFRTRGQEPTQLAVLARAKVGELRWNDADGGWEVVIPTAAFKNGQSSFFGEKPFRMMLPNLAGLYQLIEDYLARHRFRLLHQADDPGTFFVKSCLSRTKTAAYDDRSFYVAWRLTIQRYGIHNPYTGRGAIVGLLSHGPHCIRDVLATHILKQTGSFTQASYAIQTTREMVERHYGRFLPEDKSAMAAEILNKVWTNETPSAAPKQPTEVRPRGRHAQVISRR